ncbi:MAG: hypothetical protein ACYS29_16010, partial [Planctomycetota bacterium]
MDRVVLDGRDNWLVHDIDLVTPDRAEEDLKKFVEKHPQAKRVPELPSGEAPAEKMDIETILEKVRQAQRPSENMRIEWVRERASAYGVRLGSGAPADSQDESRQSWSATVSGIRSRIVWRQEAFNKPTSREPDGIRVRTSVFNGTRRLVLETTTYQRRPGYLRKKGIIWLNDNNRRQIRQWLFTGDRPPIWDKEGLKDYQLALRKGSRSGILILDANSPTRKRLYRLTIDTDRGYNVLKKEHIRPDGSKDLEYNFEVKQWANSRWFVSGREKVRFNRDGKPRHIEEKFEVTSVQFNVPEPPDETFKLSFPEGAMVADLSFNYKSHTKFLVGCLSEAKHTQEDSTVTAILNQPPGSDVSKGPDEVFGPVRERIINRTDHRKDCFIDFGTGRLMSVPESFHLETKEEKWLEEKSVDARVETDDGLCGLWTFNTVVIPVSSERWDSITPAACDAVFERVERIYPPIMSAEGRLPATFLFQTWDNKGILQILEVLKDREPRSIKVRYKMIQEQPAEKADAEAEGASGEAAEGAGSKTERRHYVRLVVDDDDGRISFQGQHMEDINELPFMLSQLP